MLARHVEQSSSIMTLDEKSVWRSRTYTAVRAIRVLAFVPLATSSVGCHGAGEKGDDGLSEVHVDELSLVRSCVGLCCATEGMKEAGILISC